MNFSQVEKTWLYLVVVFCLVGGVMTSCSTCTENGGSCTITANCCFGTCTSSVCTCTSNGATCSVNGDCCSNVCNSGTCAFEEIQCTTDCDCPNYKAASPKKNWCKSAIFTNYCCEDGQDNGYVGCGTDNDLCCSKNCVSDTCTCKALGVTCANDIECCDFICNQDNECASASFHNGKK